MKTIIRHRSDIKYIYRCTLDSDSSVCYTFSCLGYIGTTILLIITGIIGIVLTVFYLMQDSAFLDNMTIGIKILWLTSPSICGCSIYYTKTLYRIGFKFTKAKIEVNKENYGEIRFKLVGTLSYFLSRVIQIPIGSFFFLLLVRCGFLSSFSVVPGLESQSDLVMLGAAFLLGITGGHMLQFLTNTGLSMVSKRE